MKRRSVAKAALMVAGGSILAGRSVSAAEKASKGMAGIIYTAEMEGMWAGKGGSHVPQVVLEGTKVTVTTRHGMSPEHYIVRHTLVAADGTVVGEKTFSGTDKEAVSVFTLPDGVSGKLTATSFCNHHDMWINEVVV